MPVLSSLRARVRFTYDVTPSDVLQVPDDAIGQPLPLSPSCILTMSH